MKIEFRNNDGGYMMSFNGYLAERLVEHFMKSPKVEKTTMKFVGKKEEFVVFKALVKHGYKFNWDFGGFEYTLNKDAYVKIL